MLAGLEEPDAGQIIKPSGLTVGYLPQDGLTHSGRTLLEEAGLAFKTLLDMRTEIAALEERLAEDHPDDSEHAAMLTRVQRTSGEVPPRGGLQHRSEDLDGAARPGLRRTTWANRRKPFSGGWQMRIALAKLLLGRPGLLLLDEPTNHLDLEARNWLEEYLAEYPHAVILVSHDRFFLDAVVTRITEIGCGRSPTTSGTTRITCVNARRAWSSFVSGSASRTMIARMNAFINRFRYQATKAAQVQSRVKMLEKIVPIEIPAERKRVHFKFLRAPGADGRCWTCATYRKAYARGVSSTGRVCTSSGAIESP